jgi:hypothetical protein
MASASWKCAGLVLFMSMVKPPIDDTPVPVAPAGIGDNPRGLACDEERDASLPRGADMGDTVMVPGCTTPPVCATL